MLLGLRSCIAAAACSSGAVAQKQSAACSSGAETRKQSAAAVGAVAGYDEGPLAAVAPDQSTN